MTRGETLALVVLVATTMASALGVVYVKHQNRKAFAELAALRVERDALGSEWDKLLLEQAAWANPTRIEKSAREQIGMVLPDDARIVVVRP